MRSYLLFGIVYLGVAGTMPADIQPEDLLQDPSPQEWKALEQFSGTLTRSEFETRLREIFDPTGSLEPFLKISDQHVDIFPSTNQSSVAATVGFASNTIMPVTDLVASASPTPSPYNPPWFFGMVASVFSSNIAPPLLVTPSPTPATTVAMPLTGLQVVIDPADIGGDSASMEDRSTFYPGFGIIREGDLNLLVAKALKERLALLGAHVVLIREGSQPVCKLSVPEVQRIVPQVLAHRHYLLGKTFRSRTTNVRASSPIFQKIAAEVLLTKNLEAKARAEKARSTIHPDITIVLQFDATAARHLDDLPKINRNILFVSGAYTAEELKDDPRQRLRLLTKIFQNVTPVETRAAISISKHLAEVTGFPPVLYGNSRTTRSIAGNPYVVARNILLNREHDGPVVVTEPYFMNQPVTLQRLLAGDYDGTRLVAGKERISIFREYANAVAEGILDAFPAGSHP